MNCLLVAKALGNSVVEDGILQYDIAIGEVSTIDDSFLELNIAGDTIVLDGFADSSIFQLDKAFSISSEISDVQFITVNSARTRLDDIQAGGGRTISAENIYVCTAPLNMEIRIGLSMMEHERSG